MEVAMALGLGRSRKVTKAKTIRKAGKRTSQGQELTLKVIENLQAALDKATTTLKAARKKIAQSKA